MFARLPNQSPLLTMMSYNMTEKISIFGVVFFVSNSLLGIEKKSSKEVYKIFTRKPWSRLEYSYIESGLMIPIIEKNVINWTQISHFESSGVSVRCYGKFGHLALESFNVFKQSNCLKMPLENISSLKMFI